MSYANNVKSTLNASVAIAATTVQIVKATAPFQDPPTEGKLTLTDSLTSPTKIEIIAYTGRTDNSTYWTLTGVSKAQESTSDQAFSSGDPIYQSWTADDAVNAGATGGGGYTSQTISANTTLDANTEYETGSNLIINNGILLTVPFTSKLIVREYISGKTL